MPLKVDQRSLDSGVQVLTLAGNMTLGREVQHFEWLVEDMLKKQQNRIVVDMTGVGYVDSSAIGIIVCSHGAVANAGGQLRLAGVGARVSSVFNITKVDAILHIDASPADSLRALGA